MAKSTKYSTQYTDGTNAWRENQSSGSTQITRKDLRDMIRHVYVAGANAALLGKPIAYDDASIDDIIRNFLIK